MKSIHSFRSSSFFLVLPFVVTVILISSNSLANGSLLEGGGGHGHHDHGHHHHDHDHEHHHHQPHGDGSQKAEPNSKEDLKLKTSDINGNHNHEHDHDHNSNHNHDHNNEHNHDHNNDHNHDHNHNHEVPKEDQRRPKNIGSASFLMRIPRTGFSCKDRAPGYYADMEADCQVYHMCQGRGGGRPFLCPEGTRFNQRTFVCDHAHRVKCSEASNFFHRNVIVHEESVRAIPRSGNSNFRETERNRLSKKPRLETTDNSNNINNINSNSPIFNIKVPSTIQAKSNGRMAFAPLFEEERQKNVDRFFKMVKPSTNQNLFVDKFDKEPILPNVRSSGRSGLAAETKNEIPDLGTVLGLPELPFEPPKKVSTNSFLSTSSFDDDNNEIDYDEYSEDGKLQLLPKKSAGKSVARFHKDREQPDLRLVPPPLPSPVTSSPLQLVGHILDQDDIKFIPNSPIFNITHTSSARMLTVSMNKKFEDQHSSNLDAGRHGKSGDQVLGLPLHLVPPDPVQPSPLVWISPSSLARSPMVMLRRLSTDQNEEKIERSLTMNFPARNSRRFDPLCLACFPNGSNCPVSCLSLK